MTDLQPNEVDYAGFRDLEPDGLLEQPFWERYNCRLELPISITIAILIPTITVVTVILVAKLMPTSRNTDPVAMQYLDGDDDKGVGSAGSGGTPEPLALGQAQASDLDRLRKDVDIAKIKEEMAAAVRVDGASEPDISDATAAAIGTLHKDIRDKIAGARKGSGNPAGSGGHEGNGNRGGGTGADDTRTRALRWIIKFGSNSGTEYLDQIAGLGGVVFLQANNDNSKLLVFPDPRNPSNKRIMTDDDHVKYGSWLEFSDIRRNSVEEVAAALRLGYTPPMFMVRFPKHVEEKLDKLERDYRGKDPKEIRETVYKVTRQGGSYDLYVIDQIMK